MVYLLRHRGSREPPHSTPPFSHLENKMSFKPNKLRPVDVDDLEDWQLLVAVCHYGPKMGDCISADYGYEIKEDYLEANGFDHPYEVIYCDEHSLEGDVNVNSPMESLEEYAGFNWQEWAKEHLKKILEEYWGEKGDEREIT